MSETRRLCLKNTRISREWEENGHLLYGHRNVSDNMGWMAGVPTAQERRDERDLARGVCPRCFCVRPLLGTCCE